MSLTELPEELVSQMAIESSESGVGRLLHPEDYSESEDYDDEESESEGDTVRSSQ